MVMVERGKDQTTNFEIIMELIYELKFGIPAKSDAKKAFCSWQSGG